MVQADDERAMEVLASGLPIHQGAQLATTDGAVLVRARADKEAKYTELPKKPMSFGGGGGPGDREADGAQRQPLLSICWRQVARVRSSMSCADPPIWPRGEEPKVRGLISPICSASCDG